MSRDFLAYLLELLRY